MTAPLRATCVLVVRLCCAQALRGHRPWHNSCPRIKARIHVPFPILLLDGGDGEGLVLDGAGGRVAFLEI